MTSKEFFIATIADEIPRFERMFAALPQDKLDYTPHEKSRTAKQIVTTMAQESGIVEVFLTTGELNWATTENIDFTNTQEVATLFTTNMKKMSEVAASTGEDNWDNGEARMHMNGQMEWKTTKGAMAWSMLLDLVHHRGQLSTYIRPMGGKVPSIYGPSADTAE